MALLSQRFGRSPKLQTAALNSPPLRSGSSGDAVKTLQASLVELRFPMPISTHAGKISGDGIYGVETAKIVKIFQVEQGLTVDGVAGTDTLHRLDQIYLAKEAREALRDRMTLRMASLWT